MRIFYVFLAAVFACIPFTSSAESWHTSEKSSYDECNIISGTCFTTDDEKGIFYYSPATTNPTPYVGAKAASGTAPGAIDVWNVCRYINNISSKAYFVPFNSSEEWEKFLANTPADIALKTCARPLTITLRPDARCLNPVPASQTAYLPYDPTGTTLTRTGTFQCQSDSSGCATPPPPWTETVSANYLALNSDMVSPSWREQLISYGGSPPPACVPGSCGTSSGATLSDAPKDGLCNAGAASAVSGTGPWAWTCVGSNGGTTAACSSAKSAPVTTANDGVCGPTNGQTLGTYAPTSGLCSQGTPSDVEGTGPWTWTCAGTDGGKTSSCSANYCNSGCVAAPTCTPVTGSGCGSANGEDFSSIPTSGLCNGALNPWVSNDYNGHWTWNCYDRDASCNETNWVTCTAKAPLPPPPACTPVTGGCCGSTRCRSPRKCATPRWARRYSPGSRCCAPMISRRFWSRSAFCPTRRTRR